MMKKKKTRQEQRKIAKERVVILFGLADKKALAGDLKRADEYVMLARKISMRFNLGIPKRYKRKYCKHCYCYLLPGVTSTVRLNSQEHRVEVRCKGCDKKTYYPYIRELKERRKND